MVAKGGPGCGKTLTYVLTGLMKAYQHVGESRTGPSAVFVQQSKCAVWSLYDQCKALARLISRSPSNVFSKLSIQEVTSTDIKQSIRDKLASNEVDVLICTPSVLASLRNSIKPKFLAIDNSELIGADTEEEASILQYMRTNPELHESQIVIIGQCLPTKAILE